MRRVLTLFGMLLLGGCSVVGLRGGTEERPYTVVQRLSEDAEVRHYPPSLAAETTVAAAGGEEGRRAAFRILFDYISGANRAAAEVAMTAPVEAREAARQKIAMTIPVETRAEPATAGPADSGLYAMRFFLPASFTPATAPQPSDPRVRIVEIPAQTVAVLRFSGSRSDDAVAERTRALLALLEGSGWQAEGEPVAWFYDPPWTVWLLRRNEVAVPVSPR